MPASEKQILANRQNAQKSCGPKTDQGKAISSRNAIKHGLYSNDIIINSVNLREDRGQFEALVQSVTDELNPESEIQHHLVSKIAVCLWRHKRAVAAETSQLNRQLDSIDNDIRFDHILRYIKDMDHTDQLPAETVRQKSDLIKIRSIPHQNFNLNLIRYEMRLERQLSRSLRFYKQLKNLSNSKQTGKLRKKHKKIGSLK
jgi:hypothetical protein